jgi:CRISPR-associated exonuclease Cas4
LDREWTENRFTAEGRILHDKAHDGPDESRPGLRLTRALPVSSESLGLHGVCDVVEFHSAAGAHLKSEISNLKCTTPRVVPVEYKRGKPKAHRADEVQLCAQALCLEEQLDLHIPEGALYYGKPRRRTVVPFDEELRTLTLETTLRLHTLIAQSSLPRAVYEKRKCGACSLIDTCQPRAQSSAQTWLLSNLKSQIRMTHDLPTL